MFNKKKCQNCGEKISNSYNFCPYCNTPLKDHFDEESFGLLGRNDSMEEVKLPLGFNHLFNSLIKNMNSQFKELENHNMNHSQKRPEIKKGGISISISTSGNRPPEIKVTSFGNVPEFKERERQIERKTKVLQLPSNTKTFSGVPKKEPETNVRRLSNKVVYEIDLPGVKSVDDVSIIQLENSIEIKALAKDKVFHKILPVNLPIRNYNLSKGKVV